MVYRRDEPFRFQFQKPLQGTFKILQLNGLSGVSKEGKALIIDLSPNGVKFTSPLNLPIESKKFLIEISFVINEQTIKMLAESRWKKRTGVSEFTYGFAGIEDEQAKLEIIKELKEYSKNHMKVKSPE